MPSNKANKKGAAPGRDGHAKSDSMTTVRSKVDVADHRKSQKSRKRPREAEHGVSDEEQEESPKRPKQPLSRREAAGRCVDARASREQVAKTSENFNKMVVKCQQEVDHASAELLDTLSSFSTEAAEMAILQGQRGQSHEDRPAIYKSSMQCLDHSRALLKAYEEHNAHVLDKRVDVTPGQWEDHIRFISKSLESGVSYGMDLVDALLRPSKEPKLPMLDEAQAEETEKLGVQLFEAPAMSRDTWGRAARLMVDGWSDFLSTPSKF